MKKTLSKTAFTLIELIIATVLVSVVILGVFAISSVLGNNNQDYGQRYLVRSATQTTLNHILNNASLAIGSGVTNPNPDIGFQIGPGGSLQWGISQNAETFCVHQDILPTAPVDTTTVNNPPTTSSNYNANTRWLCYTWYPPGAVPNDDYQIQYCAEPYISSAALQGATNCQFATTLLPVGTTSPTFLGTSFSDFITSNNVIFTNSNGQLLFTITLQNCLNNSATTICNGGGNGVSLDPVNNPEVQLTGSVFPLQEGAQQN